MSTILTPVIVVRIKASLWDGASQRSVADEFSTTQATISRIANGQQWFEIRWPDGSIGPLSTKRRLELEGQRLVKRPGLPREQFTVPHLVVDNTEKERIADGVAREIEEQEEAELLEELTDVGGGRLRSDDEGSTSGEAAAPFIPPRYDPEEWEGIRTSAPANKLIKRAATTDDRALRAAICVVFRNIPEGDWGSKTAERLVDQILTQIKATEGAI